MNVAPPELNSHAVLGLRRGGARQQPDSFVWQGGPYGHLIGPAQAAGMQPIVLGTLGVRLGWQPWPDQERAT